MEKLAQLGTTDLEISRHGFGVARIGEAAGFPSGDGLRVRIRKPAPFTLVFESPVSAVVMDPEAARTQRVGSRCTRRGSRCHKHPA